MAKLGKRLQKIQKLLEKQFDILATARMEELAVAAGGPLPGQKHIEEIKTLERIFSLKKRILDLSAASEEEKKRVEEAAKRLEELKKIL